MSNNNNKETGQCTLHGVIARLYKELTERHNLDECMILLHYQDNTLYACEQDYDSLKILEEISFNEL